MERNVPSTVAGAHHPYEQRPVGESWSIENANGRPTYAHGQPQYALQTVTPGQWTSSGQPLWSANESWPQTLSFAPENDLFVHQTDPLASSAAFDSHTMSSASVSTTGGLEPAPQPDVFHLEEVGYQSVVDARWHSAIYGQGREPSSWAMPPATVPPRVGPGVIRVNSRLVRNAKRSREFDTSSASNGASAASSSNGNGSNGNTRKRSTPETCDQAEEAEKPFKCHDCPARFARKRDRDRHGRSVHSGSTPYYCNGCGSGFVRSDARGRHWRLDPACQSAHLQHPKEPQ